ncbi:23 kDa integral membrane protein-like [Corticium candelabrum]|uniref:23 kDa integral membrane protein-like n=1 Tax=Corticium candelabrum TaxID=121492 RepID=UPI002E26C77A|nr:23 kDa integral membrane protein-like [Corticium candelabrum]
MRSRPYCANMEALKLYKLLLLVFQIVNCLVAVVVVYVGAALLQHDDTYAVFLGSRNVAGPAAATIVAGVVLFSVGATGCIGAIKENTLALAIFGILQLCALLLELTGGAIAISYKQEAKQTVRSQFNSHMKDYDNAKVKKQIDDVQKDLHCCGAEGPESWHKINMSVPLSCCEHANSTTCLTKNYCDGCVNSLFSLLKKNLLPIAGVTITFAFVQLFSVSVGVLMYRKKRREVRYQEMAEMV